MLQVSLIELARACELVFLEVKLHYHQDEDYVGGPIVDDPFHHPLIAPQFFTNVPITC